MKTHFDFLIVGQGLAGTLLAWQLLKRNKKVLIIDALDITTSSQVAAGIYIPVTGRRIVKTWMADELIPFAEKTFAEIEKMTSANFLFKKPVLEIFDSIKTFNDWQTRLSEKEINQYTQKFISQKDVSVNLNIPFGGILLGYSGFVNTSVFLSIMRSYFFKKNILLEENFLFTDLQVENTVKWKKIEATKIIFCEGVNANQNPYFKNLPWLFSKGEILTIRCNELSEDYIINQKIFVLPLGENLFRVGSTYAWDSLDTTPTEKAKEEIAAQLKNIISAPFEIIQHHASVRPTVQGRRPFIGLHPAKNNIGIFNGLGTKGVMLAPFFSNQMAEHLINGTKLNDEININRYSNLL